MPRRQRRGRSARRARHPLGKSGQHQPRPIRTKGRPCSRLMRHARAHARPCAQRAKPSVPRPTCSARTTPGRQKTPGSLVYQRARTRARAHQLAGQSRRCPKAVTSATYEVPRLTDHLPSCRTETPFKKLVGPNAQPATCHASRATRRPALAREHAQHLPPGHLDVTVRERSRRALGQPERRCWGSNTARREGADLVDTAHPAKAHPTGLAWHAGPRACVSAAACSRARVGVTVKKKDEARLKHLKWHRGQPRTHQKRPREARRNWREEGTKSSCPPPAPLALGPLTTSAKTSTPTRSSHATTTTTTTKTHTPRGREAL